MTNDYLAAAARTLRQALGYNLLFQLQTESSL